RLSLHDALPISRAGRRADRGRPLRRSRRSFGDQHLRAARLQEAMSEATMTRAAFFITLVVTAAAAAQQPPALPLPGDATQKEQPKQTAKQRKTAPAAAARPL